MLERSVLGYLKSPMFIRMSESYHIFYILQPVKVRARNADAVAEHPLRSPSPTQQGPRQPPPSVIGNIVIGNIAPLEEVTLKPRTKLPERSTLGTLCAVPAEMMSPALANLSRAEHAAAKPRPVPLLQQVIPIPGVELAELLLGRLAVCGFIGVKIVQIATGNNVFEQAAAYPDNVVAISLAIIAASLAVKNVKKGVEVRFLPYLALRVEKGIARFGMLAFGSLVAWELINAVIL